MKKHKINRTILTGAALVLVLVGLFIAMRLTEPSIPDLVRKDHAELEEFAALMAERHPYGETVSYREEFKNWSVTYWPENSMVEFVTDSSGFGSSSTYQGFYYSPDDLPLGFQGRNVELVQDGGGWTWRGEGDNRGYTERIMEHWFSFEAHF